MRVLPPLHFRTSLNYSFGDRDGFSIICSFLEVTNINLLEGIHKQLLVGFGICFKNFHFYDAPKATNVETLESKVSDLESRVATLEGTGE